MQNQSQVSNLISDFEVCGMIVWARCFFCCILVRAIERGRVRDANRILDAFSSFEKVSFFFGLLH